MECSINLACAAAGVLVESVDILPRDILLKSGPSEFPRVMRAKLR